MSLPRRNSPFGELLSLRQAMDRLFEESYVRPRAGLWAAEGGSEQQALPLDVYTEGDDLVVQAALPGVRPEEVDITVAGETLTISGSNEQRQERREGEYLVREVRRGTFSRTLTLPADLQAEKATADFQDGMLTLRIPKAEQARPRQIRIPTSGGSADRGASGGSADRGGSGSADRGRSASTGGSAGATSPGASSAGTTASATSGSSSGSSFSPTNDAANARNVSPADPSGTAGDRGEQHA